MSQPVADKWFQQRLSPHTADNLDPLSWDEVCSDLEWQGTGSSTTRVGRRGRRDATGVSTPSPATIQQTVADLAVLDQYFAQVANDSDQIT